MTKEEIKFVTNEINSELAKDKNFKVDEYLKKVIELKKAGKEIGIEAISRNDELSINNEPGAETNQVGAPNDKDVDALSSATYYNKANWENKIKDKSRWKVGDNQTLVRVTTSEPVEMNDIDYDGNFVDANGRTVLRMVYKEKAAAVTTVWYRAIFNFGDLDQYIDYDKSYIVGVDTFANESKRGTLDPFNDRKERIVDLGVLRGDATNQRKNLPINLVLKEGYTIKDLVQKNYIVQMRLADKNGKKIYAYAPKGSSMDYSSYTKTTSVSLEDKVNRLFIKGGYQKDNTSATNQEFVMSEFIANPNQYKDEKNLGIIRTQYMGQRAGNAASPTVGGQPIAFTQAFDAKLLDYLKPDDAGNVAYVNVLTNKREKSEYSHNFGIKLTDFNKSADGKLAYLVIAPHDFQKEGVKKVEIPKHDQYSMLSGFYVTAIDYVVDKSKFEDTFAGRDGGNATRKLNYSMISGWTNPNVDGWAVYEKTYDDGYVAHEGESFIIDTTTDPADKQIMIQVGNEDAVIRRQQGYYTYYVTGNKGIETIEKYADGIFKFDLREGATIKPGDKIKIFMPYAKDHDKPVNFLEIKNGTELNKGGATLTLQKDRNINMHLYKEGKKGYYILKYTLADGTKAEKKFEPKVTWSYDNKDRVIDFGSSGATLSTGGNFYINTKKLKPGEDIIVESYDENGTKLEDQTSWFKYRPLTKSQDTVKELTWTDHSDKSSILSINKSLYTPYQVIFTNDYAEGTDDFYKDPRAFTGTNEDFMKDTKEFVGYTKYDGGKVRVLQDGKDSKLYAKVEADENEYNKDGNLVGEDKSKMITIPKSDIFDAQFDGDNKEYRAYEYRVDLTKMLPYHSDDKTERPLTLLKDMKILSTASDGSSLPSDLYETRVRARVLFDANTGKFADGKDKEVKIAPDNINFLDQEDYKPNGFEGANVKANTGDKFAEAPTLEGKNFLGWVTEAGKKALGDKTIVTADEFAKLTKDQIFTNETPITKHLVVYAVYSNEVTVTFDAVGGKFTDGKDTTNVEVEGGSATKPADPTKDGFTFKGWADTKDATTPNVTEFTNITSPKTYYAVWEQTNKEPLKLNDPEKTVVKDIKSLTEPEQEKVEAAVIKENPDLNLTPADVVVADDGTVTVTKNGQTGTITSDKTVTQKEVTVKFNPPKEPVPVDNKTALTDTEKQAVRDAVKEANKDRNLKDDEITVGDDGKVTINQNGKTGEIPADKTVVQKDTILNLEAPDKTEVKDVTNLTQDERDKVAAAVKAKNNLADGDKIEVDSKGNVTVTTVDGKKTGTLEGKDTVKPFDRAGKTLNNPKITPVSDLNKLTDYEKNKVRDAVKTANPDLDFKDDEIQVADDGTVTVPMGKDENKTIEPKNTVRKDEITDNKIALKAPEKTPVQNLNELTEAEKGKVKEAVKKANTDLPGTAKIDVAEDGSVIVTDGNKTGALSQKDTVVDDATKLTLSKPTPVKVKDLQKLTPEEQKAVKDAVKAVNPGLTDDQIIVDNKGNVTVTVKEGKTTKTAQLGPKDTIEKDVDTTAPAAPKVEAKDDGSVTVTPPKDADTKSVEVTYKDNDGNEKKVTATK
ncbi:InlB B-repeat-containing protein, partial [Finegoldia magna]|uniref:InlB B-repeat-containing protein n=1 Tax=Finegoldia magna TaxID=1260 RepID=UPI0011D1412C